MRLFARFPRILIIATFFAPCAYGKEQHRAHVHGEAKLNIAVEGKTAEVEFEAPAMSIYGFEHEPKNPAQTKARDLAVELLKKDAAKMFAFEEGLSCKIETKKVEPLAKDEHSSTHKKKGGKSTKPDEHGELHAQFSVKCEKNLSGSTVKFGVWTLFPQVTEVHVQIIGDKSQGGGEVSKKKDSLKL